METLEINPKVQKTMARNLLQEHFYLQQDAYLAHPYPTYKERLQSLNQLIKIIKRHQKDIVEAITKDFKQRHPIETKLYEMVPSLHQLKYIKKHLKNWMRPEKRPVSIWFQPGHAKVLRQPLGVVGIMVPWNYPFYLTLGPLACALAAGNRVMIKFSEYTPYFTKLMTILLHRYFTQDKIFCVSGDVTVAEKFSRLPFDHLLFTGSSATGKHIMRAACENLTPVTLELGGKSPCIIAENYSLKAAAKKIIKGKLLNSGQTCIAPDYLFIHENQVDEFITIAQKTTQAFYPNSSQDLTAIINQQHYQRIQHLLEDAKQKGAVFHLLTPEIEGENKITPMLVFNTKPEMLIMQQEIFGPILPIVAYQTQKDFIDYIQQRPRPLALYYFGHNKEDINTVLQQTISGGVTINDTLYHIGQDALPFGGVGNSGMGHYHGLEGFNTFSKVKPIFYQSRFSTTRLLNPPYTKLTEFIIKILLK